MNSIKSIMNIVVLNIRYVLFNYKSIGMISIIFFTSFFIPLIFVPLAYCISLVLFWGIILPSSIIYISTTYNWRSGTLKKNLESVVNKNYFYIGSFITMIIYVYISLIPMLIILWMLQESNLLMSNWRGSEMSEEYQIFKMNFEILYYSLFEMTLVTFGILFLAQNIIKSEKGIYALIAILVILSVILGGVFNNAFAGTPTIVENDGSIRMLSYRGNIYGEKLYYPIAILFPYFGPMQHAASLKWSVSVEQSNRFFVRFFIWQGKYLDPNKSWHWDILWLLPYLQTAICGVISIYISKAKY